MSVRNKDGSISVFICIVLSALISAALAMLAMSKLAVKTGYVDSVLSLAGRSALSEYNPELQARYGLFAVSAFPPELERKIEKYSNYSFDIKDDISLKSLKVDTDEHSYRNLKIFAEDIRESLGFVSVNLLKDKKDNKGQEGKRVLRNKIIIGSLPSENEELFSDQALNVADGLIVDQYIMTVLDDGLYKRSKKEGFFRNEIEYIICGHKSDAKNYKRFGMRISSIRLPINLAFIYSRPDMMAKVNAAAQVISPGPGGALVQFAVASAWAGMESDNDLEIVRHGGKLPLVKSSASWATDISSLLSGGSREGYIDTKCKHGMDYQDFLRSQLLMQNRKKKILRLMDLMQINIQGTYDKSFSMLMAHRGMSFRARVDGRRYAYEERF